MHRTRELPRRPTITYSGYGKLPMRGCERPCEATDQTWVTGVRSGLPRTSTGVSTAFACDEGDLRLRKAVKRAIVVQISAKFANIGLMHETPGRD